MAARACFALGLGSREDIQVVADVVRLNQLELEAGGFAPAEEFGDLPGIGRPGVFVANLGREVLPEGLRRVRARTDDPSVAVWRPH